MSVLKMNPWLYNVINCADPTNKERIAIKGRGAQIAFPITYLVFWDMNFAFGGVHLLEKFDIRMSSLFNQRLSFHTNETYIKYTNNTHRGFSFLILKIEWN